MSKSFSIIATVVVILVVGLTACSPTGVAEDQSLEAQVATDVQATLDAKRDGEELPPQTPTEKNDSEEPPTSTEEMATATSTTTPTSSVAIARVNENTNCRSGQGTEFDLRYIAMAGENLIGVARTTLPDYVVVEIPDKPGEECWLWTRYVDLLGNWAGLPERLPRPTPTPKISFSVVYDYMDGCVGWDPAFKITNTGNVTFQSSYVNVTDTVTSTVQDHTADNFDETNGCPIVQAIPQLDPGMTGWAHAYSYIYDPAGNPMQATVKVCTGPGLTGSCVSQSLNFTP